MSVTRVKFQSPCLTQIQELSVRKTSIKPVLLTTKMIGSYSVSALPQRKFSQQNKYTRQSVSIKREDVGQKQNNTVIIICCFAFFSLCSHFSTTILNVVVVGLQSLCKYVLHVAFHQIYKRPRTRFWTMGLLELV